MKIIDRRSSVKKHLNIFFIYHKNHRSQSALLSLVFHPSFNYYMHYKRQCVLIFFLSIKRVVQKNWQHFVVCFVGFYCGFFLISRVLTVNFSDHRHLQISSVVDCLVLLIMFSASYYCLFIHLRFGLFFF